MRGGGVGISCYVQRRLYGYRLGYGKYFGGGGRVFLRGFFMCVCGGGGLDNGTVWRKISSREIFSLNDLLFIGSGVVE